MSTQDNKITSSSTVTNAITHIENQSANTAESLLLSNHRFWQRMTYDHRIQWQVDLQNLFGFLLWYGFLCVKLNPFWIQGAASLNTISESSSIKISSTVKRSWVHDFCRRLQSPREICNFIFVCTWINMWTTQISFNFKHLFFKAENLYDLSQFFR